MSPVFVKVIRLAECAICYGRWRIDNMGEPDTCAHCGSPDWMWGVESHDVRLIRQGVSRLRRRLNPGAKSKARQDRAKAQGQAMQPRVEKKGIRNLSRPDRGRP